MSLQQPECRFVTGNDQEKETVDTAQDGACGPAAYAGLLALHHANHIPVAAAAQDVGLVVGVELFGGVAARHAQQRLLAAGVELHIA